MWDADLVLVGGTAVMPGYGFPMMVDPGEVRYFTELAADECWALLREAEVGRVAWGDERGISVLPVNYQVVDRVIVFHTSAESSLPVDAGEAAFQVDVIDTEVAIGWSVLARGRLAPTQIVADNISWLAEGRHLSMAIVPRSIDGRVISGVRRSTT